MNRTDPYYLHSGLRTYLWALLTILWLTAMVRIARAQESDLPPGDARADAPGEESSIAVLPCDVPVSLEDAWRMVDHCEGQGLQAPCLARLMALACE